MVQQPPAAIVGIGATEFSKFSGRSELRLALEACTAALADAGVAPRDVDGLVTFGMDNNDEHAVARNLGIDALTFFARTSAGGGGGPGTVALASMAIATGKASTVICYRAMNERSQQRFGQPSGYGGGPVTSSDETTCTSTTSATLQRPAGRSSRYTGVVRITAPINGNAPRCSSASIGP